MSRHSTPGRGVPEVRFFPLVVTRVIAMRVSGTVSPIPHPKQNQVFGLNVKLSTIAQAGVGPCLSMCAVGRLPASAREISNGRSRQSWRIRGTSRERSTTIHADQGGLRCQSAFLGRHMSTLFP